MKKQLALLLAAHLPCQVGKYPEGSEEKKVIGMAGRSLSAKENTLQRVWLADSPQLLHIWNPLQQHSDQD